MTQIIMLTTDYYQKQTMGSHGLSAHTHHHLMVPHTQTSSDYIPSESHRTDGVNQYSDISM